MCSLCSIAVYIEQGKERKEKKRMSTRCRYN